MMRIRHISLICLLLPTYLLVGCSGGESGKNADSGTAVSIVVVDTVPAKPEKVVTDSASAMEFMRSSDHWPQYSRGILPRMVAENLPYAKKLLANTHDYFVVVDKGTMRVLLYDKYGVKVKDYGMACARNYGQKREKGDCRTPEGCFEAEGVYNSKDWLYVDDDGVTHPEKGAYGERYIRVKNPITWHVGIHGTNAPWSIGRRASHGCIRMKNEDNLDLVQYVEKGTPIIINPGPRDISVNKHEDNKVTWITVDDKPIKVKEYPYPYAKEEEKPAKDTSDTTQPEEPEQPSETPAISE